MYIFVCNFPLMCILRSFYSLSSTISLFGYFLALLISELVSKNIFLYIYLLYIPLTCDIKSLCFFLIDVSLFALFEDWLILLNLLLIRDIWLCVKCGCIIALLFSSALINISFCSLVGWVYLILSLLTLSLYYLLIDIHSLFDSITGNSSTCSESSFCPCRLSEFYVHDCSANDLSKSSSIKLLPYISSPPFYESLFCSDPWTDGMSTWPV